MLKNPAATTETTKRGQKDFAATLGPLDLIIIKGKSIDILKIYIKRMLHGSDYMAPSSVGLFKGNHDDVSRTTNMEVRRLE